MTLFHCTALHCTTLHSIRSTTHSRSRSRSRSRAPTRHPPPVAHFEAMEPSGSIPNGIGFPGWDGVLTPSLRGRTDLAGCKIARGQIEELSVVKSRAWSNSAFSRQRTPSLRRPACLLLPVTGCSAGSRLAAPCHTIFPWHGMHKEDFRHRAYAASRQLRSHPVPTMPQYGGAGLRSRSRSRSRTRASASASVSGLDNPHAPVSRGVMVVRRGRAQLG
jgi:hypothetical protein